MKVFAMGYIGVYNIIIPTGQTLSFFYSTIQKGLIFNTSSAFAA